MSPENNEKVSMNAMACRATTAKDFSPDGKEFGNLKHFDGGPQTLQERQM
jgi:hypothetical protein